MAKQGMRRPDPKEPHGTEGDHRMSIPKNEVPPVPEIQGKAKTKKVKAKKHYSPCPGPGRGFSCGTLLRTRFFSCGLCPHTP